MPSPTGDRMFSVKIDGLSQAERIPGGLAAAQRAFVDEASEDLAAAIRGRIRSRTGRLASTWTGHAISSRIGIIESEAGLPYRVPSTRGAFIVAKNSKALRFVVQGRVYYRKWVRLAPGSYVGRPHARNTGYVNQALRNRRAIVLAAYQRVFNRLEDEFVTRHLDDRGLQ